MDVRHASGARRRVRLRGERSVPCLDRRHPRRPRPRRRRRRDDDRGHRGKSKHDDVAWFASGGAATSRVFRSRDGGKSWKVYDTPIRSNEAAGTFALAFRDTDNGIAVGGDLVTPAASPGRPRADAGLRADVEARRRRAERVPLGRPLGRRSQRDRGRADRQRRDVRPRPLVGRVRRRQLRHRRLRQARRLLGLGRDGPRRPPDARLELALLQILRRRALNRRAVAGVPGAVARAVPAPLRGVPVDEAVEVPADGRQGVERALLVAVDGGLAAASRR